ncbi:MAG: potassium channel protein [Planctomycetota bacterium]
MIVTQSGITQRLFKSLFVLGTVVMGGAVGYYLLEGQRGWTAIDAIYMSVITVATVGYGEVHDLDQTGRLFTVVLILCGVGAFTYTITSVGNYLIAGELKGIWDKRRMEKKIIQLNNHYIVCGFGRMGYQVADEFRRQKHDLVVVDRSEEAIERARTAGFLTVLGDAGDDETLNQAGIERARGLVTAIDDDAKNVLVVLSARSMNESLFIVSRANVEGTESKLITAGANRVLWPYGISGRRLTHMALRPHVVEFLELVMHDEELELIMEELTVAIGSALEGAAIQASGVRGTTGATIVALRKRTGKMLVAPGPDTVLEAGDILVALGTRVQLEMLHKLAHHPAAER